MAHESSFSTSPWLNMLLPLVGCLLVKLALAHVTISLVSDPIVAQIQPIAVVWGQGSAKGPQSTAATNKADATMFAIRIIRAVPAQGLFSQASLSWPLPPIPPPTPALKIQPWC